MSQRTPPGFYVAGCCAALFTLAVLGEAVGAYAPNDVENLRLRAVAALLAGLGGVAVEALLRTRPWAYRASLALALTYAAGALLLAAPYGAERVTAVALWLLVPSAMALVPTLMYLRDACEQMFAAGTGTGTGIRTARRLRPVAAAASRGPASWRP